MAKPADTQCRGLDDGDRCENQIAFDSEGDYWSVFCSDHLEQDNTARSEGGERVLRYDREEEDES